MTCNRKLLFKPQPASLTTPTKYSAKLVECFSSVWYVIPLMLVGPFTSRPFSMTWQWKILQKMALGCLICYQGKYFPNGGIQWWLLGKPWTSSIRRSAQYGIGAPPWLLTAFPLSRFWQTYLRNSTILGSSPNMRQPTNITIMVNHLPPLQYGFNQIGSFKGVSQGRLGWVLYETIK